MAPDGRQHPRPQHPPMPDVDRVEHHLYRRQPPYLAAERGRRQPTTRCTRLPFWSSGVRVPLTRPHFHQADQFQVVVAGHGMLGDREFSDGAVHYTDAYSAYGPIVAGKSGIWWFTLRNRYGPPALGICQPSERC